MAGKSFCGMCGTVMFRIPIPSEEKAPFLTFTHQNVLYIPSTPQRPASAPVMTKLNKWESEGKIRLVECVLDQWGCPKDNCGTIQSYWYRKDGKEGDLFILTKQRQGGKGAPLVEDFAGIPGEIIG